MGLKIKQRDYKISGNTFRIEIRTKIRKQDVLMFFFLKKSVGSNELWISFESFMLADYEAKNSRVYVKQRQFQKKSDYFYHTAIGNVGNGTCLDMAKEIVKSFCK